MDDKDYTEKSFQSVDSFMRDNNFSYDVANNDNSDFYGMSIRQSETFYFD